MVPTMTKKSIYNILFALGLSISVCAGSRASLVEDSLTVTDVTPVQFCVVWTTSEPATGWVDVFFDPNYTEAPDYQVDLNKLVPFEDAKVKFESLDHPPAADNGVMKVKVTGLQPGTNYYFQAKDDKTDYSYPSTPPFIKVRTERESIPVRNDVIAMKVTVGEEKPALGMVVVASIVDNASNPLSSYPVTGWVGHGVADQYVLIDTNNFYYEGKNIEVTGGEQIRLKLVGGLKGSVETQDFLPDPTLAGGIQALTAAASLPDTGSGSTPDPVSGSSVSPVSSGGGGGGVACFITAAALGSEANSTQMFIFYLLVLFGIAFLLTGVYLRKRLLSAPM
jgi:hypothetical protein